MISIPIRALAKVRLLRHFRSDRRGVTSLEYGIIAGVLGLVLVTIFTSFGTSLKALFVNVAAKM